MQPAIEADVHYRIGHYPTQLITQRILPSGAMATLRPALPQDTLPLASLFASLTPQDRHHRFFAALRLSPARLAQMVSTDPEHHLALIVTVPQEPDEVLIAEARYAVDAQGGSAEFAVTVDAAFRRQGIARWLLKQLASAAAAQGLLRLRAEVMSTNAPMLALLERTGFEVGSRRHEPWLRQARGAVAELAAGPEPGSDISLARWVREGFAWLAHAPGLRHAPRVGLRGATQ